MAIGGLGGSGTRVFAKILKNCGYHLGNDLNDAEDNLTYTLLFKRHSSLLDSDLEFSKLAKIFISSLKGDKNAATEDQKLILKLTESDRMGHSREWLLNRAEILISMKSPLKNRPWGWKEPNTHIHIEKFLNLRKDINYIHVLRNPYYMANSKNKNQLINWGSMLFDTDVEVSSSLMLKLWIKSYERIRSIQKKWPGRVLLVWYDDLFTEKIKIANKISSFLNIENTSCIYNQVCELTDIQHSKYDVVDSNFTNNNFEEIKFIEKEFGIRL